MANEYLDLLQDEAASIRQEREQKSNPYVNLLDTAQQVQNAALRGSLTQTLGVNPNQFAEKKRVADYLGYPTAAVEAQPNLQTQAKIAQLDAQTRSTPVLRQRYTEADFAKLAHDDSGVLGVIERLVRDMGVTAVKGAVGLPQAAVGLANIPTFGYAGKAVEGLGIRFGEAQAMLDRMYSPATQRAKGDVQQAEGFFGTLDAAIDNPSVIATAVGESLPQIVGGAAVARGLLKYGAKPVAQGLAGPALPGALTRVLGERQAALVAGALGEGTMAAGSAAEQIRQQAPTGTLSVKQVAASIATGVGTAGFSLLGGKVAQKLGIADIDTALASGQLTQKTLEKGLVRSLLESGLSEGLLEELPQSAQEQVWMNIATDRPVMQGVSEAAAMGLLAGTAAGSGFQAIQFGMSRLSREAQTAQATYQSLEQLRQFTMASELLKRDPQTFKGLIDQYAQEGPVNELYIDARIYAQAAQDAGLTIEQLPTSVQQQLNQALASGSDLRIPLAEFQTEVAPTDYGQSLLDHVKPRSGAMTRAEAQVFMQTQGDQLKADVERVIVDRAGDSAFKAGIDAVRSQIAEQLNAAGRFTPETSDAQAGLVASFYGVTAAKMGVTPEALFARYPLRVQAQEPGVSGAASRYDQTQGPFGPVMSEFKGNAQGAITKLLEMKTGEAIGALSHPEIGDIDLVWGEPGTGASDGYGLAKLARWHPEVLNDLQGVIASMKVVQRSDNRVKLESADHRASVRLTWDDQAKNWLLTAFEKRGATGTTTDTAGTSGGDDTARPADASDQIVDQKIQRFYQMDARYTSDTRVLNQFAGPMAMSDPASRATTPLGFYSALADGVAQLKASALPVVGWKDAIKGMVNKGQVKADEVQWTGIIEWLDLHVGKVTKERVQDYLNASGVQVEETVLGADRARWDGNTFFLDGREIGEIVDEGGFLFREVDGKTTELDGFRMFDAVNEVQQMFGVSEDDVGRSPKFAQYGPPGGENYREVLLTLPVRQTLEERQAELRGESGNVYKSNHWEQDNVLAHLRLDDRTDADGKRVLFIREIQSDWGQEGREKGFVGSDTTKLNDAKKEYQALVLRMINDRRSLTAEDLARIEELRPIVAGQGRARPGVPAAPFVTKTDAWVSLALKRAVILAAQEGYDKVAIINGDQAVQMFPQLEDMVDSVRYAQNGDGNFDLEMDLKRGGTRSEFDMPMEKIAGLLGKEMSERIARSEGQDAQSIQSDIPMKQLTGVDLKVGGEGMRAFYDSIVPKVAKDVVKRLGGGQVKPISLDANRDFINGGEEYTYRRTSTLGEPGVSVERISDFEIVAGPFASDDEASAWLRANDPVTKRSMKVASFDITPAMHEKVETGVPLFQDQRTPRGSISFPMGGVSSGPSVITLLKNADLSTFLHESGHFFLEVTFDLAARMAADPPDSPDTRQLQQDTQALLKWFGVNDLQEWFNLPMEQKRAYHEQFARGFEAYLFEGKAPSVEMQSLFQRFRAWLVNIYKDLKVLNVTLTDEVREVMDRMIATNEQIEIAQQARSMIPLFTSAQSAGMTPEEFADYQALGAQSTADAIEDLQARTLRDMAYVTNARSREVKKLQKQAAARRAEMRIQARSEVMAQPVYRAWAFLTGKAGEAVVPGVTDVENADTTQIVGKLRTGVLKQMYGEGPDAVWRKVSDLGMTSDTRGSHPDILADMFGFESGDDLVRSLAIAEAPLVAIEALTDQRMLENYGELATPEAIERATDIAIYNETRARFVATELAAINKAAGKPKLLVTAAKQFAQQMIGRLQIRNIKPGQYAAAEARAARAAATALRTGDTATSATEKRNQLINAYAAKAAYEAQADVARIRSFFARVTKGGNKTILERGRDPDVVNAARAILAAYGVAPRLEKGATEYLAVLEKNDPGMYGVLRPSIEQALINAKPLEELTIDELRALNDEIGAMWHLAKRSRQMEVDGNLLDLQEVAQALTDRMQEIGVPDQIPGEAGALTRAEEAKRGLQFAGALLRRVEQWSEAKDGRFGGPFLRYVFQPVKAAADRYRADRVQYRSKFVELLKTVAPSMKVGTIQAPELGYTFGRGHNGVGSAELLHAVLHTGNDSNKRKLLLGRGWASERADGTLDTSRWDAFISRMWDEGVLTKAHYDFAQGVWDLLEAMKPLAQKTHRTVFGRYFDEVTANAVETPFGTYRGGYVPAQADPRIVNDAALRKLAEEENESMAFAFPAAAKGFTKGRVEYNRPLILDLRTLTQHIDKVLLFSHMEPAVRDVNKLLMRKGVSQSLSRIDPGAYEGMLIPWLNRAARQQVETPIVGDGRISRMLSVIRNRAGMALMFGNISNTLQQITGLTTAAVKVKPAYLRRATAQYIANPQKTSQDVADASIYMRDRMANEIAAMNNEMDAILLDPSLLERGQAWTQRHAYFLQAAFDNVLSPIVWTGAYNQALTQGMTDTDAVKFADGVVRQTQGTTLPEDISRIESGPTYARLFTQFIGYFNMLANTNATELMKVADDVGLKKGAGRALAIVFYGLLAPAWIAEAIALAFKGGPEDDDDDGYLDDWLAAVVGLGTLKTLIAGVPFVGQFANAAINRFNDNPVDDRVSLSPAVSLLESAVGAPQSVYKALTDDGSKARAVKDVATAVSLMTGLPVYAVARPLSYLAGLADERIEPTGPLDAARGLVTGTASPESRVP